MKQINTNDWLEFSHRRNSVNYISKDNSFMLKVLLKNNSLYELEKEKQHSDIVEELGFLTPKAYEVVQIENGNYGIIYENIKNKMSLPRIIAANPDCFIENVKIFANIVRKIHNTECNKKLLPDLHKIISDGIKKENIYSKVCAEKLLQILESMKHSSTCLHGDLQPSNIIVADGKYYLIDFDLLSYGNPMLDLCWFNFLCNNSPDLMKEHLLKCNSEIANLYWQIFSREYFETENTEILQKEEIKLNLYFYLILVPRVKMGHIPPKILDNLLIKLPDVIAEYEEAL